MTVKRRWATGGFVAVVLVVLLIATGRPPSGVLQSFDSPGGRYRIVVLWKGSWLPRPAMPGQGGDGDGIVQLTDRQGHVLRELEVESPVFRVDQVTWSRDQVDVKLVVQWPLDPPDDVPAEGRK